MRAIEVIVLFAPLAVAPLVALAQTDLSAGERTYAVCAGCHGFEAEGNVLVAAPRLAGLEPWYVEQQMLSFNDGIRGQVDGDVNGQRMALMARAVKNERELADLVAYVATLPGERPPATVDGDVEAGRRLYALCATCHALDGSGSHGLSAPGLVALDDWYLIEQLRLYAAGLRGTEPTDIFGQQMRALISSFDTDEERRNLAAYINSL